MITSLTERYDEETKLKVLTCDVEGVPQPNIQWNINYTKVSVTAAVYLSQKADLS